MRSRLISLVWVVALGVTGVGLFRLGDLDEMVVDWADFGSWLATADVEVALAALARFAGLLLFGWIVISTIAYAVARLAGARRSTLQWLSVPPLRRAVDALLAGSLLLNTMVPAGAGTPRTEAPAPTQETVHPAYVPVPAGPALSPSPPAVAVGPPAPAPADQAAERSVVVATGDNLWVIAERHLRQVLGREPDHRETAPYWAAVIEANRHRIRSGDPDLIYAGEDIVLPDA